MDELTITLIRLGFLAVLWIFVLSAVTVIRTDIFGTRVPAAKAKKQASKPPKAAKTRKRVPHGQPRILTITGGPNAGQSVQLDGQPVLLGRGTDAAIRLNDDFVSTRHARFATNGEQWFVEDLGSTNGTFIGNQRVTTPTPIALGTAVRLGKTIVELRR